MEVVLFHITTRPDVDEAEYEAAFVRMMELVAQVPGFLGFDAFTGQDGSELAVARFEDEQALAAWRDQPEHVDTRRRGRQEFFAAYDITIATVNRHYAWSRQVDETGTIPVQDGDAVALRTTPAAD